jgi:hypothetical protein
MISSTVMQQQMCERLLTALEDTRDPCARVLVGSANAGMATVSEMFKQRTRLKDPVKPVRAQGKPPLPTHPPTHPPTNWWVGLQTPLSQCAVAPAAQTRWHTASGTLKTQLNLCYTPPTHPPTQPTSLILSLVVDNPRVQPPLPPNQTLLSI